MTFFKILFLLIPSLSLALNICQGLNTTRDFDFLFSHCLNHPQCSHQFGLDTKRTNRTLFETLSESVVMKFENYGDPLQFICNLESDEQLLEFLWPLILITESQENFPICPLNHELRIRSDSTMHCVCSAGSDCDDMSSSDNTLLIILLYILIAAAVILVLIIFLKTLPSYINLFTNGPLASFQMPESLIKNQNELNSKGNNKKQIQTLLRRGKRVNLLNQ